MYDVHKIAHVRVNNYIIHVRTYVLIICVLELSRDGCCNVWKLVGWAGARENRVVYGKTLTTYKR